MSSCTESKHIPQAIQNCIKRWTRRSLEAKSKHGVHYNIAFGFPWSIKHMICIHKRDVQRLQLCDQTLVQRLVCLLGVAHLDAHRPFSESRLMPSDCLLSAAPIMSWRKREQQDRYKHAQASSSAVEAACPHLWLVSKMMKVPCSNQAIPAIVAWATDDQNTWMRGDRVLAGQRGGAG